MLAIAEPVTMDQGVRDQYSNIDFNEYHYDTFHHLPYSTFESNPLILGAAIDPMTNAYMKVLAFQNGIDQPPSTIASSVSAPSIPSASSSNVGSPYSGPIHTMPQQDSWATQQHLELAMDPTIINGDGFGYDLATTDFEPELKFELQDKSAGVGMSPTHSSASHVVH